MHLCPFTSECWDACLKWLSLHYILQLLESLVLFLYLRMPSNIYHIKVVSFFSIKKIFFIILSLYLKFLVQLKCSIKNIYHFVYLVFPLYFFCIWNVKWIFIHASQMGINASQFSWIIQFFNKIFPYLAFKTPWKFDIVDKSVSNQFNIFCLLLLLNR